ncbi:MAG: TolB family protein [Solirubrobacteraceae bacterium]
MSSPIPLIAAARPIVDRRALSALLAIAALVLLANLLPSVARADACPNEQLRREDNSTALPDCRAYELVSPPQKNGGVVAMSQPVMSSRSGQLVQYGSTAVFANAQGSPLGNDYVATRGEAGWSTVGIEAPQYNEGVILATPTQGLSEDLTKVFQASAMALTPGAIQGEGNIYIHDDVTGQFTLVGVGVGPFSFREFGSTIFSTFIGATPDFSHVVFDYPFVLAPGAVEGGSNLYDYSNGKVSLVNYLPDETITPEAKTAVVSGVTGENPHVVSSDGSKIFFSTSGGLFARVNDSKTVALSVSQRAGDSSEPQPATFMGASADGSKVYFTSLAPLTEDSDTNYDAKLYQYDFSTGKITDIAVATAPSDASTGAAIERVIQVSEDGSYVYFTALSDLAPGATTLNYGEGSNVYVWHEGQGIRFIAQASVGGQVSPNGQQFAFVTSAQLTSYNCGGCATLYEYNYDAAQLSCVSCNPEGAPPSAPIEVGGIPYGTGVDNYHPRYVLDNGTVFFDSRDPLVPSDSNGEYDVYQWRAGHLELISSGTAAVESAFADASPDGKNVFFKTGQKLIGQDVDEGVDLYDAREGGGYPQPPQPLPCSGTGCQGVPPAPPIFATPPSETFEGTGNFESAPTPTVRSKPVSVRRARKLARALKSCHKHKRKRKSCEAKVRKRYGVAASRKAGGANALHGAATNLKNVGNQANRRSK